MTEQHSRALRAGLRILALASALALAHAGGATAEDGTPKAAAPAAVGPVSSGAAPAPTQAALGATRGPVTNLPLPRFVSLKASEGNARRGPSLSHRIDWVFTRRAMPLEITAEFGHWRRVRDQEGAGGWVHYSLLSGARTVLIRHDMLGLLHQPAPNARVVARAEAGVIARLGACLPDWCRITAGGMRGWVEKSALWGVAPDEIRE